MSSQGIFLRAEWRNLIMLNYEVDPGLLASYVPGGTEIDQWNGKVFISMVGFRFLKTRVCGISFPFHRNFDEVNLRFYVRRKEGSEIRRGVVFIQEIVPRWAIAAIARTFYNEKYIALPMRHQIQPIGEAALVAQYEWRSRLGWNGMRLETAGKPSLTEEGSEEQFITEHYWGYAAQRDGGCMEYRVAHPSWKVWTGRNARLEGDLSELYGKDLAGALVGTPTSAFLAEGSEVTVHRGRKV